MAPRPKHDSVNIIDCKKRMLSAISKSMPVSCYQQSIIYCKTWFFAWHMPLRARVPPCIWQWHTTSSLPNPLTFLLLHDNSQWHTIGSLPMGRRGWSSRFLHAHRDVHHEASLLANRLFWRKHRSWGFIYRSIFPRGLLHHCLVPFVLGDFISPLCLDLFCRGPFSFFCSLLVVNTNIQQKTREKQRRTRMSRSGGQVTLWGGELCDRRAAMSPCLPYPWPFDWKNRPT